MVVLLVVLFSDDDALLFVVVTFEFELFWAYDDLINVGDNDDDDDGSPIRPIIMMLKIIQTEISCRIFINQKSRRKY